MSVKSQVSTKDLSNLYHHSLNLRKGGYCFTNHITDLYLDLIFSFEGQYIINFQVDVPDGIEPKLSFELIKSSTEIITNETSLEVNYSNGKRHSIKNKPYQSGTFTDKVSIPSSGTYALRLKSNTENLIINGLDFEGYGPVVIYPITTQFQLRSRRHASAAYNNSYFEVENAKYFYREIIINKHQPNTYYTFAFVGGYLGLVLKKEEGKSQINFSVWNGNNKVPSKMIEKSIHPNLVYRNFSHEGKGVHSHLSYPLEEGSKYGLLIHLDYNTQEKATYYTGYFIDLSKNNNDTTNIANSKTANSETANTKTITSNNAKSRTSKGNKKQKNNWYKLGCIRREGKFYIGNGNADGNKYPTRLGGFIENTGCFNGHLWNRQFQMGNDFVSIDGEDWISPKCMVFTCKDNRNANCKFLKKRQLLQVEMGGYCGNKDQGSIKVFHLDEEDKKLVPKHLLNLN